MFNEKILDKTLQWDNFSADFSISASSVMSFSNSGKTIFEVIPVSFGLISEDTGIASKLRRHVSLDGLSVSAETKAVLPFGTEPVISRSVEFAFNHGKVTTDVDIRKGVSGTKLSVDSLKIHGRWEKAALVSSDKDGTLSLKWIKLDKNTLLYNSAEVFTALVLEDKDGFRLEIGTGNDLWRWNSASNTPEMNASSSFKIEKKDDSVLISRDVFFWKEETPMTCRNWRFHWYFAWGNASQKSESGTEKLLPFPEKSIFQENTKSFVYDFNTFKIPAQALASFNGVSTTACFQSHITQNALKKIMRSAIQTADGHRIGFHGILPHICGDPKHLDRSGRTVMLHWDMISLMDFLLWANRQLIKNNSSIYLSAPEENSLSALPSVSGMAVSSKQN